MERAAWIAQVEQDCGVGFVASSYAYYSHPAQRSGSQFVLVPKLPLHRGRRWNVVLVVHGGFWKSKWSLMNALRTARLARFLLDAGYAPVFLEYRRRPDDAPNAAFPGPNADLINALRHLRRSKLLEEHGIPNSLNAEHVILLGHSAGGSLALWAGTTSAMCSYEMEKTAVGSAFPFEAVAALRCIKLIVAVAPVANLEMAYYLRLSDQGDAVQHYLDLEDGVSPSRVSERCRMASPAHAMTVWAPFIVTSGGRDTDVPEQVIESFYATHMRSENSVQYIELDSIAGASAQHRDDDGPVEFYEVSKNASNAWLRFPRADHFELFDPDHISFQETWRMAMETDLALSLMELG
ncbi:hypothetical protein FVE85_1782 [Porphyridium purpureum]|uniref:BD-FAE-like domain-containing protein n=1 Tax=Porphyridium purpureum TaxID=35688 RepID=A0A5J4YYT9_PORPP|nr:hypothetical protein FVE85_1782 [Porphyridium purpureum]|eukprot:POR6477..scf209_3